MQTVISIETPDAKGLVYKITGVFYQYDLNITNNEEHVDPMSDRFYMTTEVTGEFDREQVREDLLKALGEHTIIRFKKLRRRRLLAWGEFGASRLGEDEEASVVLVKWNSEEGWRRLSRSYYKESFFELAHVYQPQRNPFFCGISSSVIVLNALRLKHGLVPCQIERESGESNERGIHYRLYCQRTFLNDETEKVKPRDEIAPVYIETEDHHFDPGLALHQLQEMLRIYKAETELHFAETAGKRGQEVFREHLRSVLSEPERFMVVNYEGEPLGTATGGHFAPVAAYDEESDSVMLLDVAAHKNPWYWAPLPHLYNAMNTKDGDHYRGYLIVTDKPGGPTFI